MLMLSLREPKNKDNYVAIKDPHLSLWLQRNNFHPRYAYENIYYYVKTDEIENAIKFYETMQCESEVSEFGKNIQHV